MMEILVNSKSFLAGCKECYRGEWRKIKALVW